MAQVIRPQTDSGNDLRNLLTIGGAVVGGVYGGAPGAAAGAGLGQMAGGMLAPQQSPQQNPQGGSEAAAMARRQAQMSQDNLGALKQAEATLPSLPENLRQEYAPAIVKARMMAQQGYA